ncbi:Uncharacterised protein [Bordetella pertussis]|nr:Uncharacterised protein [Bordetella pertussis]
MAVKCSWVPVPAGTGTLCVAYFSNQFSTPSRPHTFRA